MPHALSLSLSLCVEGGVHASLCECTQAAKPVKFTAVLHYFPLTTRPAN